MEQLPAVAEDERYNVQRILEHEEDEKVIRFENSKLAW